MNLYNKNQLGKKIWNHNTKTSFYFGNNSERNWSYNFKWNFKKYPTKSTGEQGRNDTRNNELKLKGNKGIPVYSAHFCHVVQVRNPSVEKAQSKPDFTQLPLPNSLVPPH